jgi:DNA cross-link repair 1A protein
MGITALGPRKKIVHALSELRRGCASSSSNEKHGDAGVDSRKIKNQKGKSQHDKSERNANENVKPAANKLITEYFPGFVPNEKKASATAAEQHETKKSDSVSDRKRKAKDISTSAKIRDVPKWCAIQGTPFRVVSSILYYTCLYVVYSPLMHSFKILQIFYSLKKSFSIWSRKRKIHFFKLCMYF